MSLNRYQDPADAITSFWRVTGTLYGAQVLSELSPAKREPDLCDDIRQVGGLRFPTLPTSGFLAVTVAKTLIN